MFPDELVVTAQRLVELCREGREAEGLATLYAPDAESVEAADMSGQGAVSAGRDAISAKHAWWKNAMDVHAQHIDGPYLHSPDRFSLIFEVSATERESGKQLQFKEVAVYTLRDGLILREEFYYSA